MTRSVSLRVTPKLLGLAGTFAYSISNFFLLFSLQQNVPPFEFGLFALAQVFLQFGISLSNALFCSPIVVVVSRNLESSRAVSSFSKANLVFCTAGGGVMFFAVLASGGHERIALIFGALFFVSSMRWFFRAVELAHANYVAPALADIIYSAVVVFCTFTSLFVGELEGSLAASIQTLGCIAALLATLPKLGRSIPKTLKASLAPFRESLRKHGAWALLGVVTTEMSGNAHAWILGVLVSPAAFAPVAAITLFYRPVPILTQALTQYERPKLAFSIERNDRRKIKETVRSFRVYAMATWLLNTGAIFSLCWFAPEFFGYGAWEIQIAALLLAVVFLARVLRAPESAALQAGGKFRPLALVTAATAPVSLVGVALLLYLLPGAAAASLVGVAVGEILMAALIAISYHKHLLPAAKS